MVEVGRRGHLPFGRTPGADRLPGVIEVAVRRLRAKVDDDFETKLIRTVRGMGYVLKVPEEG